MNPYGFFIPEGITGIFGVSGIQGWCSLSLLSVSLLFGAARCSTSLVRSLPGSVPLRPSPALRAALRGPGSGWRGDRVWAGPSPSPFLPRPQLFAQGLRTPVLATEPALQSWPSPCSQTRSLLSLTAETSEEPNRAPTSGRSPLQPCYCSSLL